MLKQKIKHLKLNRSVFCIKTLIIDWILRLASIIGWSVIIDHWKILKKHLGPRVSISTTVWVISLTTSFTASPSLSNRLGWFGVPCKGNGNAIDGCGCAGCVAPVCIFEVGGNGGDGMFWLNICSKFGTLPRPAVAGNCSASGCTFDGNCCCCCVAWFGFPSCGRKLPNDWHLAIDSFKIARKFQLMKSHFLCQFQQFHGIKFASTHQSTDHYKSKNCKLHFEQNRT